MAYFDWNATAPMLPEARDAWLRVAGDDWGNPSTPYRHGARAKVLLESARERIAGCIGVKPGRIIFTSGATESNNAFLRESARRFAGKGDVWISAVEHPSVREAALALWGRERVVEIPVSSEGVADVEWIAARMKSVRPCLVCIMAVNNETGVIQPWSEVLHLCKENGVAFHCDAVQWWGKAAGRADCWDACSGIAMSAHKFGGPRGTGCLVMGEEWLPASLSFGGGQELGSRAGTEDVASIVSMATALQYRLDQVNFNELAAARDAFEDKLQKAFPGTVIHGQGASRVWNTTLVSMPEFESSRWIAQLDKRGHQISTGAACSTGKGPSKVLSAMGVQADVARRAIRISGGWETRADDWSDLLEAMIDVGRELKSDESTGPGKVITI